jgi:hypothetical protein
MLFRLYFIDLFKNSKHAIHKELQFLENESLKVLNHENKKSINRMI